MTHMRALVLIVLGLAAIGGCATNDAPPFVCSADTCTGCCQGNNCIAPPDETACGVGGAACAPCRANELCSQGRCVPNDCNGCVDPSSLACLPGSTPQSCGVGGVFCASCGTGTICSGGRCVSDACAGCKDTSSTCQPGTANAACGVGGGACAICTAPMTCQDKACAAPKNCTPTSCPTGCCDASDMCQTGNTVGACGSGGAACSTCAGTGATCTAGACKTPCGPGNCAGCCDSNGMCVASTNPACGQNGVACTACTGANICSNGKCIDTSCKSTCPGCCSGSSCQLGNVQGACGIMGNACIGCANGQVCASGVCQVDPNSLWDFQVTSGTVPGYASSGSPWDSFSQPDPYVEIDYGPVDSLTHIFSDEVDNTLTPDWSSTTYKGKAYAIGGSPVGIKASDLLTARYLGMWDSDDSAGRNPYVYDDDMGYCSFTITAVMFDQSLRQVTCGTGQGNSRGVSWSVYFRLVPHM